MASNGWIKIHRQIRGSIVYKNPILLKVWLECLLCAHFDEDDPFKVYRGGNEYRLKRGEFVFGRKRWAEKLNMPPSTIRNAINTLRKVDMIEDRFEDMLKPTIYMIVNWNTYQKEDRSKDRIQDRSRTGRGQVEDTYQEGKNERMKESKRENSLKYLQEMLPEERERLVKEFPGIDVDLEARKALNWLKANGKAKKDYKRFFDNWLIKSKEGQSRRGPGMVDGRTK